MSIHEISLATLNYLCRTVSPFSSDASSIGMTCIRLFLIRRRAVFLAVGCEPQLDKPRQV